MADAREALTALREALEGTARRRQWEQLAGEQSAAWAREVARLVVHAR